MGQSRDVVHGEDRVASDEVLAVIETGQYAGNEGSKISSSASRHTKRNVTPRMYSLG